MKKCEKNSKRLLTQIEDAVAYMAGLKKKIPVIDASAKTIVSALKNGGKILTAGNGGSAAEALHMAEELTGRFRTNRRSLPGLALVADPTALTCIGNDFGFDSIFSRQIEGLGRKGDVLVLFSTSGKAANLVLALEAAKKRRMKVICLLGRDGGALAGRGDHEIIVAGTVTERIQEVHQVILHLFLDAVENNFIG